MVDYLESINSSSKNRKFFENYGINQSTFKRIEGEILYEIDEKIRRISDYENTFFEKLNEYYNSIVGEKKVIYFDKPYKKITIIILIVLTTFFLLLMIINPGEDFIAGLFLTVPPLLILLKSRNKLELVKKTVEKEFHEKNRKIEKGHFKDLWKAINNIHNNLGFSEYDLQLFYDSSNGYIASVWEYVTKNEKTIRFTLSRNLIKLLSVDYKLFSAFIYHEYGHVRQNDTESWLKEQEQKIMSRNTRFTQWSGLLFFINYRVQEKVMERANLFLRKRSEIMADLYAIVKCRDFSMIDLLKSKYLFHYSDKNHPSSDERILALKGILTYNFFVTNECFENHLNEELTIEEEETCSKEACYLNEPERYYKILANINSEIDKSKNSFFKKNNYNLVNQLKEECICKEKIDKLINSYFENYQVNIIEELKLISTSYDSYKLYLKPFIEFKYVESEYPHEEIV